MVLRLGRTSQWISKNGSHRVMRQIEYHPDECSYNSRQKCRPGKILEESRMDLGESRCTKCLWTDHALGLCRRAILVLAHAMVHGDETENHDGNKDGYQ